MLKRVNTGVFLNQDELQTFKELAESAQMEFPADVNKGPIEFPKGPWERVFTVLQTVALEKGLPDVCGYYGVDLEGQFVTYSDVPDFEETNDN